MKFFIEIKWYNCFIISAKKKTKIMSIKKLDFKTVDVLEEICKSANVLSEEITNHFSSDFYFTALDLKNNKIAMNERNFFVYTDIQHSPIALNVLLAHEFAQGRIWFEGKDDYDPKFFLAAMEKFYSLIEHTIEDTSRSKFGFLLNLGLARQKLDNGEGYFSFNELALLTGVDERTVRNAASSLNQLSDSENEKDKYGRVGNNRPQKFGRLKTEKIGSTLLVRKEEAMRWLTWRGFQFTRHIEMPLYLHPKKDEIYTKSQFCQFMISKVELIKQDIIDSGFTEATDIFNLSALKKREDPDWSISQIILLSNLLSISLEDLFLNYMKFFYPENSFDTNKLFPKDTSSIKDKIADLIYFKKILRIKDDY